MKEISIINQEYLEFIVDYGHKFDSDIFNKFKETLLIEKLNKKIFSKMKKEGISLFSNIRIIDKETKDYINKKLNMPHYKKYNDFFMIKESTIENFYEIFYDDILEEYFFKIEKKGYNVGYKSFNFPSIIEIKDYFTAKDIYDDKQIKKIEIFDKISNKKSLGLLNDNELNNLRELGTRVYDATVSFNSEKKMAQFISILKEESSHRNYTYRETSDIYIVLVDSVYLDIDKLNKILSYKNNFRKEQFDITKFEPAILNCPDFFRYKQNKLEKKIDI